MGAISLKLGDISIEGKRGHFHRGATRELHRELHPEPVVRVATWAALFGDMLGVAAFLPALAEVVPLKSWLEHTRV